MASKMLADPVIKAVIDEAKAKQLAKADLSAVRVLEELRRIAFVDARQYFDDDGNLRPVSQWTPEMGSALAHFEVIKKNAESGDGHIDVIHKVKLWDKPKSLEMLARHFSLLVERTEASGGITIQWLAPEPAPAAIVSAVSVTPVLPPAPSETS